MQRKDYRLIAAAIAEARSNWTDEGIEEQARILRAAARAGIDSVVKQLAWALKRDNSQFDRDRFLAACKES